jgi:hypothetical protein
MVKLTDNRFLFSFEGRINRAKYWYAGFASMAVSLVFLSISAAAVAGIFGADVKSVDMNISNIFGNPPSLPLGQPSATPTLKPLASCACSSTCSERPSSSSACGFW